MSDDHKKEIDDVSGVETTGHEWDGLKELNNPLPRWWLWVWLASIVWGVIYFTLYPAWPVPGGHTKGALGYTQFNELKENQAEITERQSQYLKRFENASYKEIFEDPELYALANAGGASAFKDNCATCHGAGGVGAKGYPNLNDDDWLWGGKLADIEQTLKYGIRAEHIDTRVSQMPAFGKDGLLSAKEISTVVDFVLALSDPKKDAFTLKGAEIFAKQCASCHGPQGKGDHEFGAPNLTDKIWLYGGDRHTLYETIFYARGGVMPNWEGRLDSNTIRQLAVYLHELGGGEEQLTMEGNNNDHGQDTEQDN